MHQQYPSLNRKLSYWCIQLTTDWLLEHTKLMNAYSNNLQENETTHKSCKHVVNLEPSLRMSSVAASFQERIVNQTDENHYLFLTLIMSGRRSSSHDLYS